MSQPLGDLEFCYVGPSRDFVGFDARCSLKVAFRNRARLFFAMIWTKFFGLFVVCLVYFCDVVLAWCAFCNTFATCCATLVVKSQGRFCVSSSKTAIAVSLRATLAAKSQGRSSLYGVICTFMWLKCRTIVSEGCPMCSKSSTVASSCRAERHFMV